MECYFGTSDYVADQRPIPTMVTNGTGVTIHFPSVIGNAYQVECSQDLSVWTPLATVNAAGSTTDYTDAGALLLDRCFYRVVIP